MRILLENIIIESIIDKAFDIAQYAHLGQYRKVSKKPYITHPARVYGLAKQFGLNQIMQVVAILHDTYEDSKDKSFIVDLIRRLLGNKFADMVIALSHDKEKSDYNTYIVKLFNTYPQLINIKLLDMYNNLLDNPSPKQIEKYRRAIQSNDNLMQKHYSYIKPNILSALNKFLKI